MNSPKAGTLRSAGIVFALALGVSCKLTPTVEQAATAPSSLVDLSSRRLEGRQTLRLAADIVLHADRIVERPDGVTEASGAVYLNGHGDSYPVPPGWPIYAYSASAEWKPTQRSLTLTGWPILEYRRARITSTAASCSITLDGSSVKVVGPATTVLMPDTKPSVNKPRHSTEGQL